MTWLGGAAGAMSRITGTLGKGVAALTLDDDYKRRRREEMTRTPDNFGAGMARGGKGLVMASTPLPAAPPFTIICLASSL